MANQASNVVSSQTNQQFPPYYSPCYSLGDSQLAAQDLEPNPSQLVAGMGSLSVSGLSQLQSPTQMSSPHRVYALQQVQQQSQTNHSNHATQHYGQLYAAHGQDQSQNHVATSQLIQYSNTVSAPRTQSTGSYPTQNGNGYYNQQPPGQKEPEKVQTDPKDTAAAPRYTSHAQHYYPGYESLVVDLQQQNIPRPQSSTPSTTPSSAMNTPATTVSAIASPASNNTPSAYQPNQAQFADQSRQPYMNPQPTPSGQLHQPHTAVPQPPGPIHHPLSQNSVLYPISIGQNSLQNSMPAQQAPVPPQYQPSQAVQIAMQEQTNHQHRSLDQPHQPCVQQQSPQPNQTQPQPLVMQSGAQRQHIQHHQNSTLLQPAYGAHLTVQSHSQDQGLAQNHRYQPPLAHNQQNPQPMQQQMQQRGQQQFQFQPQSQQALLSSNPHQQPPNCQPHQQYHQLQPQPQYQSHTPQSSHLLHSNAAQQQYNLQVPQRGQRQYPSQLQQQVYQPQIANAQFMPSSYKPPQAPNHTIAGTAPPKPAPKFANDPMAATTSFLGKSYKSTTKFLGTKRGLKFAAGGAGVLLAGFLGAEVIDGLGDSGDAFTDGGSGGFDTGGGYDASGGGYETGASGGVDAGSSYAQTDVQGMADANSLAMQQALEQQGQMNAQALIGNYVVVQGGQSFSTSAGNSYGLI